MKRLVRWSFLGASVLAATTAWAQTEKSCDRLVALTEQYGARPGAHPLPMNPDQAKALQRVDDEQACRDLLPRVQAAAQAQAQSPVAPPNPAPASTETVPVSQLKEKPVFDTRDREIGEVERVVMDDDGSRLFAVIGMGGFLGLGERRVAVPLEEFALKKDKLLVRRMSEEDLRGLPAWRNGKHEEITGDRTAQMTILR